MDIEFSPNSTPLSFLRGELLPELHPDTKDSTYLDRLSAEQLTDFTYRKGVRTDEVGDGNCLVPQEVGGFDDAMFRNPPAHRVKFIVTRDSLESEIAISFDGFAGTQLELDPGSWNPYHIDPTDVPDIEVAGETHDLYTAERPFNTTARPVKFAASQSGIPIALENSFEQVVTVPGRTELAAKFNPRTGETEKRELSAIGESTDSLSQVDGDAVEVSLSRPEINLQFSVSVDEDIEPLGAAHHTDDFVCVTVSVRNLTPVEESEQETWAERRVFYPSLKLDLGGLVADFPTQQHDVKVESARQGETTDISGESLYRQQECVLTRVVDDFEDRWESRNQPRGGRFRTTSFGVYDYVEETPVKASYRLDELVLMDDSELVGAATHLTEYREELLEDNSLLPNLRAVLLTLRHSLDEGLPPLDSRRYREGEYEASEPTLHEFQWAGLQKRIEALLNDETNPVVVQAPTSAGKTLVYYGSTMLSVFERNTRAAFPFPTRMLTEDKLEEVIDLAFAYNRYVKNRSFTADPLPNLEDDFSVGVVMGQQESNYSGSNYLHAKDLKDYIGDCHVCGEDLETRCEDCESTYCADWKQTHLHFVKCTNNECGFVYDFVYDVQRTPQYLPDLTVGTPEKFFTMSTVETGTDHSTFSTLPFYGAPYRECEDCGRALSDMNIYSVAQDRDSLSCAVCRNNDRVPNRYGTNEIDWSVREPYSENARHSPIGHVVLDETHMYTGQFGISISVILRFFEVLASRLESGEDRDRDGQEISADSGTATISNELEHLSRLLRTPTDDIAAVPDQGEHREYFDVKRNEVRYRVLTGVPVDTSNRGSFSDAVVHTYDDFHNRSAGSEFTDQFTNAIEASDVDASLDDYKLILGYLHRRSDGYALQESIPERAQQISDGGLNGLQFISGDSSKSHMRSHMGMGAADPDPVVLANLVVSLGIDIPELNNLILYGAPRSMSEQMQTIGRTGRDDAAGHAAIHLYPGKPRDMQIERKFHQILGNVDDYYDRAAIHSSNPHIVDILFDYVIGPFLTLEFAIGENYADQDNLHILQDLVKMFDNRGDPRKSTHTQELFYDMKEIFCPEGLDLEAEIIEVISNEITQKLFGYVGTQQNNSVWFEPAMRSKSQSGSTNINEWFKENIGDLEFRGESEERIELTTEYCTPSEVDL